LPSHGSELLWKHEELDFRVALTVPYLPMRWWPLLILQGLLDAGAYLALLAGSHGENNEITAVIASAFSAVTVLLAWLILREAMTWRRWSGVALIICGVAVLSIH
jgi:drug/metabolite transporter (DMT)-like permease